MRLLTEKVLAAQNIYTDAMAVGYREEQIRRARSDESQRSLQIDALLHGRIFEQWSVWEAADYLRLPTSGPFVAVAAEVPGIGAQALPDVESKLRGIDVYSAWHVHPDLHAGIVHIKTEKKYDDVVAPPISAPEVMVDLATPIIECFAGLPDNERETLFDTFKSWLDNDGSLRVAGPREQSRFRCAGASHI